MNNDREEMGLNAKPLALEPRIVHAEPITLRPAQALARNTDNPATLLLAAVTLIPHQPTTEQWQIIKNAILELHNAA